MARLRDVLRASLRRFGRAQPAESGATPPVAGTESPLVLGLGMVKNEQDVIEPFVRHNLQFLDAIVLLDNGSVDATRQILAALSQETGRVAVADAPLFGYRQAEWMTRLLHAVQDAFFADYLVPLDADEFITAPDRAAFLGSLARIPPREVGVLSWRTLVPAPDDPDASADPPRTLRRCRTEERPQFCKSVLRLDGAGARGLALSQGNHDVLRDGARIPPVIDLAPVTMRHAPVRSQEQIVAKAVVGWLAYVAKDPDARNRDHGTQWRELFDRVADGGLPTAAELTRIAQGYAQSGEVRDWTEATGPDCGGWTYARQHSTGRPAPALAAIARTMEQALATRPAFGWPRRPEVLAAQTVRAPGAFDPAWHWDNLFFDVPPLRMLADRLRPDSVLDIGCGLGLALTLFARQGARDVFGLDSLPAEATAVAAQNYRTHDLTTPFALGRSFDLAICLEVAEHMPPGSEQTLFDCIARHARGAILFSAAEPGQPGNGHVNCRPLAEWLAEWRGRGWAPELIDSLALRSLASLSWLRRNPVLLRPIDRVARDGTARLLEIAARPFAWWGQTAGIRETMLDEPMPPPGAGYG